MAFLRGGSRSVAALGTALLLLSCGTSGVAGSDAGSTKAQLTVRIVAAPSCPVERLHQLCPPMPVRFAKATLLTGHKMAARGLTDAAGVVRLDAPVGTYTLAVRGAGYPVKVSRRVQLHSTGLTLRIMLDTGLR